MSGAMSGLLTPQQQLMLNLMSGNAPQSWSLQAQNAPPGPLNAMSGLPTAAGVALPNAGAVGLLGGQQTPAAGAQALPFGPTGQPTPAGQQWVQHRMGPLAAAEQAGLTQQQNVYGGGQPISERNAGLLGAAGFPSFQDPRLIADSLATAAQQPGLDPDELQRRQDAFARYMRTSGGGGGGGGDGGREGEGGAGGGGASASGGGQGQDASGQW